jgi:hypothetical protein
MMTVAEMSFFVRGNSCTNQIIVACCVEIIAVVLRLPEFLVVPGRCYNDEIVGGSAFKPRRAAFGGVKRAR